MEPSTYLSASELTQESFQDFCESYRHADGKQGMQMLNEAFECAKQNTWASRFLCVAARDGHRLPELIDTSRAYMWKTLEGMFWQKIHERFPTYRAHFEILMSGCANEVFSCLHKYDERYAPGTYFMNYALHGAWEACKKELSGTVSMPVYKKSIKEAVLRQADALVRDNIPVTVENLHNTLPNISMTDIKAMYDIIAMENGESISLDQIGDGGGYITEHVPSPEEQVIKKAHDQEVEDAVHEIFTDRQFKILKLYYHAEEDEDKRAIFDNMIKTLSEEEGYTDVTENEIKKLVRDARSMCHRYARTAPKGSFIRELANRSTDNLYVTHSEDAIQTSEQEEEMLNTWDDTIKTVQKELPRKSIPSNQINGQMSLDDYMMIADTDNHESPDDPELNV